VPPESRPAAISSLIADHLYTIPHVHVLSELTGLPDHWNPQQIDGLTGIHLEQNLMLPLPRLTKRCMDLVASIIGGIILLPLFFYLAVAVKMSSRGPIVYYHERIGINGRRFKAWKFRTMFQNADAVLELYLEEHPELREEWERDHKLKFDPRVTRIGKFLRKTSLDELPQLWNVIWGDMSLVGPRPIVEAEIVKYGPYYGLYTMVKPGITGLWQVSGRNNTTYDERVQFDAYYVRNWSPWLDLYLLLRTIRIVLFAKGAY
jgi:Undecaprenyl-phosphate galactose phosphotransferase WbaP